MRTALELQGIACAGLDAIAPKQTILSSKSYGQMQKEFERVAESIGSHCARATEKLRAQHSVVQRLGVFVHTNPHRHDLEQYYRSIEGGLASPTDDVRVITALAKHCLRAIFKEGYWYKKAGVFLYDLRPKNQRQYGIFNEPQESDILKSDALMAVFDQINHKYGRHTIRLASEGACTPWAMRAQLKSPAYTTRWSELPSARVW